MTETERHGSAAFTLFFRCFRSVVCPRETLSESTRDRQGCQGYDTTQDTSRTTADRDVISTHFTAEKLSGGVGTLSPLTDFSFLDLKKNENQIRFRKFRKKMVNQRETNV